MADTIFYPSISSLLPLESIPPNLGFIQGALQDVFDNLYFRDLQVQKSKLGDAGFYQLSLVIYKRLGFEIPGTGGAALVLNPGYASVPTTEIPIALSYRWEIVKYIKGFDNASLTELPRLLFDAFVEISGATPTALLSELIDRFHGTAADPVQAFVDAYNLDNVPTVLLTKLSDPNADAADVIEDLLGQLDEIQKVNVYELVFAAYLNVGTSVEDVFAQISAFFSNWVKDITVDDFKSFLLPHCSLAIKNIKIALEFPRTVLIPVDEVVNSPTFDEALPAPNLSRLSCTVGSIQYSTDTGMEFTDGFTGISFTKSLLGNTGITLGFTNMKLDLSRTTNIPEATADGRPVDFIGVYVQQATIGLPKKWFKKSSNTSPGPQIIGSDIIMGSGGFTGKIRFDANGVLHTQLGNIEAGLTKFDLRFERNAIVESNIAGWLTVPGFKDAKTGLDATIDIKAHIAEDGDFSVTATEKNGILVKIPDVLDFKIYTLGFGREDDRFFLTTSGNVTLRVLDKIPALKFDRPIAVDLKKLLVWQDGQIEIEGGNIILPKAVTLKIGPVKLSVTAISMGSYTRDNRPYKYFGFDGGVNVNPGGVDVRASGVKVYYSTDSKPLDVFVRVEGIAIDLIFPGSKSAADATVLISGFLQVKEPDPTVASSSSGSEYAGGVSFTMPKAGIRGCAAMRLNPSIPNFIIDAELNLSVPLLLGNTNLAVYTFRGLIGMSYVADRPHVGLPADANWYEYYKKKVQPLYKEGISIDKFAPRKGLAVGAGVTLGSADDSGKKFSAKLFLLLTLPDAFLLQGQAAIMSERVDLSPNDPPFTVFIAITKQSMEAAFGVNYKLPEDSGAILDLQALIEMGFYFNDSSAWYINLGRDLPVSKRVTARLFTLFNAWSYLMLSASGIKAGAGVTWDFNKGFGPIRVEAHAYLDVQGHISYKPKQIGGAILLGGSASVRVFKFKLGLSVAAVLAAEAPQPFIVTGSVNVNVELPKPFKKFGGTVTLDFTWTFVPFDLNRDAKPVAVFNEADISEAAKAVNLATRERFNLNVPKGSTFIGRPVPPAPGPDWSGNFDDFVIPLDSTVEIEFKKPIAPAAGVTNIGITGMGYVHTELVPPQRGKSSQVQHQYVVEEVKIRSWNETSHQWDDYDVYAALTPLKHASFVKPADLIGLKQGWWQLDQPDKINKLSVLSQTPLSYANDVAGPFVPENSGVTTETIFCPETPIKEQCFVVDELRDLKTLTADRRYTIAGVQLRATGKDGQVISFLNSFGLMNGLALKPESQLEIFFPEATGSVSLRLSTLADNVTVLYQQRRQNGVDNSQQPVYGYLTVKQEVLKAVNLLRPIKYDALNAPINKLVIIAGDCKCLDGVPAIAPAMFAVQPGRPSGEPFAPTLVAVEPSQPRGEPGTPRSDTACGSLAAYLLNVCGEAQTQLNALQQQYEQLIAQATEYELLAEQFQNNLCDPTLPTRFHEMAKALLAEAAALQSEIKSLEALSNCCRKLRRREVGEPGPILPSDGSPPRGTVECNIDPKFDYQCMSFVFGFCWLPLRDQIFNNTIPTFSNLLGNNNAMVRAINHTIHPIWSPERIYAVSISTVDTVSVSEKGFTEPTTKYMHIGFCTKGPLGHFHKHRAEYKALVLQDRADQYRLQSLKPYIDFSKSYPDAGGNVLNAKPLFYMKPKLQLFYIHPYIYTMFGGQFDAYNGNPAVTSSIDVSILDPVNPMPSPTAVPTDPGYVAPVSLVFASNKLGHSNLDVQLLHNMAKQGNPCTGAGHDGIAPMGIQSNMTVDQLKPQKLYLALFKAKYDNGAGVRSEEIHRYNFQTSRYADFAEQVNSYKLKDRDGVFLRNALYDDITVTLDVTRTAQLTALLSHNYPSDPLEQEYADPFDRLMDGILRVGSMDPPVGTDFSVVRNGANNKVIGILVRNPEPFNDPRVPAADIATTIVLSQPNTLPASLTTLYSKDRSKAFVGVASLDLALNDLKFAFTYLEYNGATYVPASVVKASFFTSPPTPLPQGSEVAQRAIGRAQ